MLNLSKDVFERRKSIGRGLFSFSDGGFGLSIIVKTCLLHSFPKAKWGLGNSWAHEKRERGMMGTSVESSNNPWWSRATGDEAE